MEFTKSEIKDAVYKILENNLFIAPAGEEDNCIINIRSHKKSFEEKDKERELMRSTPDFRIVNAERDSVNFSINGTTATFDITSYQGLVVNIKLDISNIKNCSNNKELQKLFVEEITYQIYSFIDDIIEGNSDIYDADLAYDAAEDFGREAASLHGYLRTPIDDAEVEKRIGGTEDWNQFPDIPDTPYPDDIPF